MRERQRIDLGARLATYLLEGRTYSSGATVALPSSAYRDERRWAAERALLGGRVPTVVALSGELPHPGDFATFALPDLPTLTVRGDDGEARVFVNACRHRGVLLRDEPCGHTGRVLVCPFHAWSYRNDGTLNAIPDPSGFTDLDPAALGLVELPSIERHGMVWLLPDEHTEPIDAALADELDAYGLAGWRAFRSVAIDVPANWKLFYETFLEFYHGVYLHTSTLAHLMQRNLVHFDRIGRHWRMAAAKQSLRAVAGTDPKSWNVLDHAVVSYDLFPNVALNVHGDHAAVYRILPGDRVDRCVWHFTMLTPEPVDAGSKAERYFGRNFDYIVATGHEDVAMAASAQRTMAATERVLHGGFEPVLTDFHRWLDTALDGA